MNIDEYIKVLWELYYKAVEVKAFDSALKILGIIVDQD